MHQYENDCYNLGHKMVAGTDEAGRGPLAGPVVAAIVILPKDFHHDLIKDSKQLSKDKRNQARDIILKHALAYHIEVIDVQTIDRVNIYQASKLAMMRSIDALSIKPDITLVDAMKLDEKYAHIPIIKGDQKSISIAAASILAKTYRDDLMSQLHLLYPQYDWIFNQGYGTKAHIEAIKTHGLTKHHRKTFKPKALSHL